VACDENGLAVFERLRRKREGRHVFFHAFDLPELNGTDLRRDDRDAQGDPCQRSARMSAGPAAECLNAGRRQL
jgi:hypothetical protein